MMRYSDRRVHEVTVGEITTYVTKDGADFAGGLVRLSLAHATDKFLSGPMVSVGLAVPYQVGSPLAEVEAELLSAAHDLLNRFAGEDIEALRSVYVRNRDERNRPDPLAELQNSMGEIISPR